MTIRVFHGDALVDGIAGDDRGLAYGDGIFETVLVHRGQPVWWREHWQRFERGANVLGIPLPNQSLVEQECERMIAGVDRAVMKLLLTRGSGGRGYAPPVPATPTWLLSLHDAPPPAPSDGVTLQWCRTRFAIQPALAGIKHCNRLEQVLARAECTAAGMFDGLMCDTAGRVISATSANLFARIGGAWLTPLVQDCGVAGVARAWLLRNLQGAAEASLTPADVENAEAVFLCNAVRGILPVRSLGQRQWRFDPAVAEIRQRLSSEQPAFSFQES